MLIESLDTTDCDASIIARWQELAESASDPNPFYEPWALVNAIEQMATQKIFLTFIWKDASRSQLDGLYPLCIESGFRGLPVTRTGLWRHPYCYLCTPLIRSGTTEVVIPAVNLWIRDHTELPSFTTLYWLHGDGQVVRECESGHLPVHPTGAAKDLHRATLELTGTHADFLATLRRKKKKEWSRNWRRLAEQGDLQTRVFDQASSAQSFDAAVNRFLALENSGWKGLEHTSLASQEEDAQWFANLLSQGQSRGQSLLLEISLNEKSVGMISVITSACGSTAYTLKIATDEQFKQCSPGSQTILRLTQHAFEAMSVVLIDSCAAEDHPMINRLWPTRRRVTNLHFANGNYLMRVMVPLTDLAGQVTTATKQLLSKPKR